MGPRCSFRGRADMCQAFRVPDQSDHRVHRPAAVGAAGPGPPGRPAGLGRGRTGPVCRRGDDGRRRHRDALLAPGARAVQLTRRSDGTIESTIDPPASGSGGSTTTTATSTASGGGSRSAPARAKAVQDATGLPAAYSVGLAIGPAGLVVVGSSDDDYGTPDPRRRHGRPGSQRPGCSTSTRRARTSAGCPATSHSSRSGTASTATPGIRPCASCGSPTARPSRDCWDGAGQRRAAGGFLAGRRRPADGGHPRAGRRARACCSGTRSTDPTAERGARARRRRAGRGHRRRLVSRRRRAPGRASTTRRGPGSGGSTSPTGATTPVGPTDGTVSSAGVRPDGRVWFSWSSASTPPAIRDDTGRGRAGPAGPRAPGSVAVQDVWADGPGGRVHALLRLPEAGSAPYPTVFEVHGGPEWHDADSFTSYSSAYVDQGYAVVNVNYRGSTGYGTAWRDAIASGSGTPSSPTSRRCATTSWPPGSSTTPGSRSAARPGADS